MPMLSMKTKKPIKPMLEIPAIIEDAGPSSPPSGQHPDQLAEPSDSLLIRIRARSRSQRPQQ